MTSCNSKQPPKQQGQSEQLDFGAWCDSASAGALLVLMPEDGRRLAESTVRFAVAVRASRVYCIEGVSVLCQMSGGGFASDVLAHMVTFMQLAQGSGLGGGYRVHSH